MIMDISMMLPPGFHFSPTGEELIKDYLLMKTMDQPFFEAVFVECDLYGPQSPWQLLNDNEQWLETVPGVNTVNCIYVFTTLKNLGKTGKKRMARTAGCGSWHMETGAKPIIDKHTKKEIGKMEMFTFISNDQTKKRTKGHWIMHEFALSGSSLDYLRDESSKNHVVCKITRDDSKFLKISSASQVKKKEKAEKESENNPSQRVHVDYEFARSLGSGLLISNQPLDQSVATTSLSSLASSLSRYDESDPSTKQKECLDPFGIEEYLTQEASQYEYDAAQETEMLQEGCAKPDIAYSLSSLASSLSSYDESDPSMKQNECLDLFEMEEYVTQKASQHEYDGAQEMEMPQERCANPDIAYSLSSFAYEESDPSTNQSIASTSKNVMLLPEHPSLHLLSIVDASRTEMLQEHCPTTEPNTNFYGNIENQQGRPIKRSNTTTDLGINCKKVRYDVSTYEVVDTTEFAQFFDPDDIWGHNIGMNPRFMGHN